MVASIRGHVVYETRASQYKPLPPSGFKRHVRDALVKHAATIIARYTTKPYASLNALARSYECDASTIRALLVDAGVEIRSK